MYTYAQDDTMALGLTHVNYRLRAHFSGQISFYAGSWFHAPWSDVKSRVTGMYNMANDMGRNVTKTVTFLPNGARKITFLFNRDNPDSQERLILWIMPD